MPSFHWTSVLEVGHYHPRSNPHQHPRRLLRLHRRCHPRAFLQRCSRRVKDHLQSRGKMLPRELQLQNSVPLPLKHRPSHHHANQRLRRPTSPPRHRPKVHPVNPATILPFHRPQSRPKAPRCRPRCLPRHVQVHCRRRYHRMPRQLSLRILPRMDGRHGPLLEHCHQRLKRSVSPWNRFRSCLRSTRITKIGIRPP